MNEPTRTTQFLHTHVRVCEGSLSTHQVSKYVSKQGCHTIQCVKYRAVGIPARVCEGAGHSGHSLFSKREVHTSQSTARRLPPPTPRWLADEQTAGQKLIIMPFSSLAL